MIRYSLRCSHDHMFEDWFSNSADYDAKAEAGELSCPVCGDKSVRKGIMAPSVAKAAAAAPAPACMSGMMPGGGCGGCSFAAE